MREKRARRTTKQTKGSDDVWFMLIRRNVGDRTVVKVSPLPMRPPMKSRRNEERPGAGPEAIGQTVAQAVKRPRSRSSFRHNDGLGRSGLVTPFFADKDLDVSAREFSRCEAGMKGALPVHAISYVGEEIRGTATTRITSRL